MSLAETGRRMVFLINRRKGIIDPRYTRGTVSWILNRDGWFTPVWATLTNYSGDPNLIRFRNDLNISLPKVQWPFKRPAVFAYELTAHISELADDVLSEVIVYSELARTASKAGFDRHPPRFGWGSDNGQYGWTERAWKYANDKRR